MENPKNGKRRHKGKIECPQCKSEIRIARPRSLALSTMRVAESIAARLVLPGVVLTLGGMVWAGATAHGYHSLLLVFGVDDTRVILRPGGNGFMSFTKDYLGLPMIPIMLISSRVSYTQAMLPVLPLFFFGNTYADMHVVDMNTGIAELWPPSAAMTFAMLPYLRILYNTFWERTFSPLERKWLKEVQPRAGENEEGNENQENGNDVLELGDGNIMEDEIELELEVEIRADTDDEDNNDDDAQQEAAIPPDIPLNRPGDPQPQNENLNQAPAQQNPPQNQPQAMQDNRVEAIQFTSLRLADTILGALLFPSISAAMGQLLKLGLPKRVTTPSLSGQIVGSKGNGRPGLLQTRWGRSVVGGCLFVVLKDVMVLYCRWRLARGHRERRVLDWEGERKLKP
jgi:hypothetical protein